MKRGLLPLILFAGLIGILALSLIRGNSDRLNFNMKDKPFPEFELTVLYDENQSITEDALSGRVTLVNVFGTWCRPCLQEHPKLVEIGKSGRVNLIGLNWRDPRLRAQDWLIRHGDPYDQIIYDRRGELVIAMGVTGAPETYVIDAGGIIRYKHVGMVTDNIWDGTLLPLIEELEQN